MPEIKSISILGWPACQANALLSVLSSGPNTPSIFSSFSELREAYFPETWLFGSKFLGPSRPASSPPLFRFAPHDPVSPKQPCSTLKFNQGATATFVSL